MSETPLPPPPRDDFPPEEMRLGRGAAWILTGLFLLLLAVPPLLDGLPRRLGELAAALTGKASNQPIAERLRAYDSSVASATFTDAPRQLTQQILTSLLNKGNDRVIIGKDGWLFFRPEIQALTGYGPLEPEPHSVSRDPALLDWESPLRPIMEFGQQLKERGVALWLVPVPMKASVYPEMLTGSVSAAPLRHFKTFSFFNALEGAGWIRVRDPTAMLFAAKSGDASEGPVYLKDDTHWTTRGMAVTADFLAGEVRKQEWFPGLGGDPWPVEQMPSAPGHGDLVEKLGLRQPDLFQVSRQENLAVIKLPDTVPSANDTKSPIVVIGDSFVNIFDDPSLGFAHPGQKPRTGAGFAGNLAARLGMPLDVHAVNGEGASGVRRWLAQRGDEALRSKKLVIWVIAERDLFLSRSVAKANRVTWDRVTFASDPPTETLPASTAGPSVVEAEAVEKSEQADPRRANYHSALFTVQYRIRKSLSGAPVSGEVEVVHWQFKERMLQPTSGVEIGQVYRLTLEPWAAQAELQPINRGELGEAAPAWWSAVAEPVP